MKNFTLLLLISFLFFSCAKENEYPGGYTNYTVSTPPPPPAPTSSISISINGAPMAVTSLHYYRQTNGIWITAANDLQKVTAVASPFTEFGPGGNSGYTCKVEVSYFTRADKGSDWDVTYPRVVPRDDKIIFNECTPLRAKMLTGNFSGSFIEPSSSPKEGDHIYITGNFSLVF